MSPPNVALLPPAAVAAGEYLVHFATFQFFAATAILLSGCTQMTPVPEGSTPLATAVADRDADRVVRLLQNGETADSKDERGTAAVIIASASGQFEIANLLAQNGANLWAADTLGYTAAIYAYTSRVPDDSTEGLARKQFVERLQHAGYSWPPPWPKDVVALRAAGRWPSDNGRQ